jgi:glycosyltransferase involved in cell wall biosynthesis
VAHLICTIVMPVFNGNKNLVRAATASAVECLDEGIELLVVDSGSSRPVENDWMPDHPQARLVLFEENLGLFANWNRAMNLCNGEFVWALCADDRIVPETFKKCVTIMRDNPQIALVSTIGQLQTIGQQNIGVIGHRFAAGIYNGPAAGKVLMNFYTKTVINPFNYPSGILMRRTVMEKTGGFDVAVKHVGDLDLYFRMLAHGDLCILGEAGSIVTIHEAQTGKTLAHTPLGLIELQNMVKKLSYLPPQEREQECARLRGVLWLWAIKFLAQGNFLSAKNYLAFSLKNNPMIGVFSLVQIIFWKIFIMFPVGRHHWQSRLDQTQKSSPS